MKKYLCIITALLIALGSVSFCFAARNAEDLPNVYDEADIFTDEEESLIWEKCDDIIEKYNLDIAVVVFEETRGDIMETADNIYDENGFGCGENNSGSLLYICMDSSARGWWTTAAGDAQGYYTEDNINYLDDNLYNFMVYGQYGEGVIEYLGLVDELYANGGFDINPGYTENPSSDAAPQKPVSYYEPTVIEKMCRGIIPAVFIGCIAGFISLFLAKRSMKTVAKASTAGHYMDKNSLNISLRRDIFLYRSTTRTRIQHDDDSHGSHPGGRSSYSGGHTGSSGVSHSGGGRSF